MEGINAIVEHILEGARDRVDHLELSAAEQLAEIRQHAEKVSEEIKMAAELKSRQAAEAILNRARSQVALESRRALLEARQILIDEALETALDRLVHLEESEKALLYQRMIESTGALEGQIIVNKQDQALMAKLIGRLNGRFELVLDEGHFRGGLKVQQSRIVENLTFDLMVRNQRSHLAALAAGILFPDVV